MKYGARYIKWAPFASSADPDGVPAYGTPVSLGKLQKVTDSPSFNSVKAYGDDGIAIQIDDFKENSISVEVTTLPASVVSSIYGATAVSTTGAAGVKFGAEDTPPYGGLGFVTCRIDDSKQRYYQGIYYPKVQAVPQGGEYNTKGDTITLTGDSVQFTGYASPLATGEAATWKFESDHLTTAALAKAWVDARLGVTPTPSPDGDGGGED